jgi:formate hydrogenlyase subunit 3/multisubunit Na+/H+ antiporter MnhD subunit
MLNPEQPIIAAVLTCVGGAVLTLFVSHWRALAGVVALIITSASAAMVLWAVVHVLTVGPSAASSAFWAVPKFGFALRIHVDGLSSVFLTLAALIALPAALFSIVYMRHYADYGVARYYPNFLLFLAAMYGLLTTTDMMWFFFMFWQLMTLPGYALIRFENRRRDYVHAANKFLIMMQIACVSTMVGAELLAVSGGTVKYDFATVSANLPMLLQTKSVATTIAFVLFLTGFGIKMGMWPFGQVWLPDAHPAAPSPVSAMLSGVMIKTGVYGLMRYFLWLLPPAAWPHYRLGIWGCAIALLGTITLFTGTMQALKQDQSKRLLAFHSIGQIGYILLAVGTCMALIPSPLATLALFGALFHVLNHGLFKGLLFLNAGSMLHATGTQDLNKLGGLAKFMPLTAVTALIASFSISGVPPFNGFASKWAIYVATIQGGSTARYLPLCAIIAILTSALTLASFIKFFGTSFLSRTSQLVSDRSAKNRLEVPASMQVPQVFLATLCIALGVTPLLGFVFLQTALRMSREGYGITLAAAATPVQGTSLAGISALNGAATFVPIALLAAICVTGCVAWLLAHAAGAKRRIDEPWLCGYARQQDCHRYVAHGFYGEIKRYFGWVGGTPRAHHDKHLTRGAP